MLPKLIYRLNKIPSKVLAASFFLVEIDNSFLKFIQIQWTQKSQNTSEKEQSFRLILPILRLIIKLP